MSVRQQLLNSQRLITYPVFAIAFIETLLAFAACVRAVELMLCSSVSSSFRFVVVLIRIL